MNEFMVVVERAVRPVQAGPYKKVRMREELLAHLTSIYEEELARLGDESAARAEAVKRFGDPVALTAELQQSLQWHDRVDARLNRAFGWRTGESSVRYSARLAFVVGLLVIPFLPLTLVPAMGRQPNDPAVPTAAAFLRLFAGVFVLVPLTVFALSVIAVGMRDAMFGAFGRPKSWRRVGAFAGLSLLVFPALGVLFFQACLGHLGVLADQLTTPVSLASAVAGYLFVPVYLMWFVRKLGPAQIRHVEWATLDIGR